MQVGGVWFGWGKGAQRADQPLLLSEFSHRVDSSTSFLKVTNIFQVGEAAGWLFGLVTHDNFQQFK